MFLAIDAFCTWLALYLAWIWLEPNRSHQLTMMAVIFVAIMVSFFRGAFKRPL